MSKERGIAKASGAGKNALKPRSKDSEATRSRIFSAAKVRFSQTSYEAVGVREIAGDAGVDPALVMRYFGSKENLFREIADNAFASDDIFEGDPALLEERILQLLLENGDKDWRQGYDPFRLLLCSVSSEVAGPILSQVFHRAFVEKLARSLQGRHKILRAVLIASYILGVSLLRVTEPQEMFEGNGGKFIQKRLREALDGCFISADAGDSYSHMG